MSYKKNSLPPAHPLNQSPVDKDLCSEEYIQEVEAVRTAADRIGKHTLQGTVALLDKITKPQVTKQDLDQYKRHKEEERKRNQALDRLSLNQEEIEEDENDNMTEELFGFNEAEDMNDEGTIDLESGLESGISSIIIADTEDQESTNQTTPVVSKTPHRSPIGPASASASTSDTVAQQRGEEYLNGVKDRRQAVLNQKRQATALPRLNASTTAVVTPSRQPLPTLPPLNLTDLRNNNQAPECFFCISHRFFIYGTTLYRYCSKLMDAVNSQLIWAHDPVIYMLVDWYNTLRTLASASGIILPFVNHSIVLNHLRNHCLLPEAMKFEVCMELKTVFKVAMKNCITIVTHNGVIGQDVNYGLLKAALAISNQLRSWASWDTTKVNPRTAKWIQHHANGETDFDFNPATERNPFSGSQWHNPPFLQDVRTLVKVRNKISR